MSRKQLSSEAATGVASARTVDMKLEVVVIPVADVDRAKRFYAALGWRLDADFAAGDGLPRRPVHAAGLRVLDHLRHGRHDGRARLGPGPASDRLRHRGRARRARRPRRRRQRGVPRRRRRVPPRRRRGARQRPATRSAAATARSPRSAIRTATAGCCRRSPTRLPGRVDPDGDDVRLRRRSRRGAAARGGRARRARGADRPRPTRTGPTGTPSTWCASRPGEELPT